MEEQVLLHARVKDAEVETSGVDTDVGVFTSPAALHQPKRRGEAVGSEKTIIVCLCCAK